MPPTGSSNKLKLFVSCRNLTSEGTVKVICTWNGRESPTNTAETEKIKSNNDPEFTTPIEIEHFFEVKQTLNFKLIDDALGPDDYVGQCSITLGELLIGGQKTQLELKSSSGLNPGQLVIKPVKVEAPKIDMIDFWIKAEFQEGQVTLSKSGLTFKVFTIKKGKPHTELYTSETATGTKSIHWNPIQTSIEKLCGKDEDHPFRIEFYDEENRSEYVAYVDVMISQLKADSKADSKDKSGNLLGIVEAKYELLDKSQNPVGVVTLKNRIHTTYDFLDYLRGGLQLDFYLALDFTSSNGIPTSETSLHRISEDGADNDYQKALKQIGEIIHSYSISKRIFSMGYGAFLDGLARKPGFRQPHCFPLEEEKFSVNGVNNLLKSYKNFVMDPKVKFWGPTIFSEVFKMVQYMVTLTPKANMYSLFFILTDGDVRDIDEVKLLLHHISTLPISVVVIGIGEDDFENLMEFDAKRKELKLVNGEVIKRDIFRFFKFDESKIAEVFKGIPSQVEEYCNTLKIEPGKFIQVPQSEWHKDKFNVF